MTSQQKTNFVICFITGLFLLYFLLAWLSNIRTARESEFQSLQQQQATLDSQREALNLEHCGKVTDCTDADIMDYQFIK